MADGVSVSTGPVRQYRNSAALENLFPGADMSDGLGAHILRLGGGMTTVGPDPKVTGGQYYLVVNGGLILEEKSYPRWSLVYIESSDAALEVCAAPDGLEVLVLSFPRAG